MDEQDEKRAAEAERRKVFLALDAATKRVREGETDSVDVAMPFGTMRIYRDPRNPESIHVDTLGEEDEVKMGACSHPAAEVPPVAYPGDMPFLAGCAVMVSEAADGRMRSAMWMKPENPEAAFEDVRRQVVELGWEEQPSMPIIQGLVLEGRGRMHEAAFLRHGREGSLRVVAAPEFSQLMWVEGQGKSSGG